MAAVDLCLIADVRTQAEVPSTQTSPDALIQALITAASYTIADRCQREFIAETGSGARIAEITSHLVHLTPWDFRETPDLVRLHPESSTPRTITANVDYFVRLPMSRYGRRVLRLGRSVDISSTRYNETGYAQIEITTDQWGIFVNTADVDEDVRRACALTVASQLDRAIAEYSIEGSEQPAIRPDLFRGWPIPSAALAILNPWRAVVV